MSDMAEIAVLLAGAGLGFEPDQAEFTQLAGGVSSDIWKVSDSHRTVCVKRARGRLAVEAEWKVPVERNHFEAEFLRVVGAEIPGFAPKILAEIQSDGLIVLQYLDPDHWRNWKTDLLGGTVDCAVAQEVGAHLGRLGFRTRGRADLAARFDTTGLFEDLRLDPYLRECARKHNDLAAQLNSLADDTARRREALVHGDVSPKNILVNAQSKPLILDAECAWYGDPAFDLAFMLNHLLLKSVYRPDIAGELSRAAEALLAAYAAEEDPEAGTAAVARATRLLPALLLARIDGKSPVEYLTDVDDRAHIRAIARRFVLQPAAEPLEIAQALGRGTNE